MAESRSLDVRIFPGLHKASQALAERLVEVARDVLAAKGRFALALSGGKTPSYLYTFLARECSSEISWERLHLFWSDERCVPQESKDSNFAMAYEVLISEVPLPSQNVHRIPAEINPAEKVAGNYERMMHKFFKPEEEDSFLFDAMILGVGEDGHTASLFPGSSALHEKSR